MKRAMARVMNTAIGVAIGILIGSILVTGLDNVTTMDAARCLCSDMTDTEFGSLIDSVRGARKLGLSKIDEIEAALTTLGSQLKSGDATPNILACWLAAVEAVYEESE